MKCYWGKKKKLNSTYIHFLFILFNILLYFTGKRQKPAKNSFCVQISTEESFRSLWSWDHCVYVTFARFFFFYCVICSVLMEHKNVEDLQMQFDKNAYHFKRKRIESYWNTNEWKCKKKKSLNVDVFVHGSVYCHILDKALPLNGWPVIVNCLFLCQVSYSIHLLYLHLWPINP